MLNFLATKKLKNWRKFLAIVVIYCIQNVTCYKIFVRNAFYIVMILYAHIS